MFLASLHKFTSSDNSKPPQESRSTSRTSTNALLVARQAQDDECEDDFEEENFTDNSFLPRKIASRTGVMVDLKSRTNPEKALESFRNSIVSDLSAVLLEKDRISKQQLQQRTQPQQIIINNISKSEVKSRGESDKKVSSEWADAFREFWQSKLNRVIVLTTITVGGVIFYEYLQHKWELEEMEKRVEANLLLKGARWLTQQTEGAGKEAVDSKGLWKMLF
jgi:hypothetical protein